MKNPKTKIRTANWIAMMTPRLACLALVLTVPALVVACGSTGACEDSDYLARTASAAPEDAPAAASTAASATEGADPCDSPELAATSRSAPAKSCNCQPGDPLCSCL